MIIFDCDGVLVDSEILACRIDAEHMSGAGYPMTTDRMIREFSGRPKREIWDEIAAVRGQPWPEGVFEASEKRLLEAIDEELQAVEGVAEALATLAGPLVVASSSAPPKLRRSLACCGLLDLFEPHVFSASQVARGKPAPDVFFLAADTLGVRPTDCIVIEDSTAGVKAARAAGMTALGFTGGRHSYPGHADRLREAGAAAIVAHMRDLPAAVASFSACS